MLIKSLNGIQPSILAPTILQNRQILLYSTCDLVYSELCWCVIRSWKSGCPGLLLHVANLQCMRWRVWVRHRLKYSHHCEMWPVLARSSACLCQQKCSLVCAHTKQLKSWKTFKALTPVFFKACRAAFSLSLW